LIFAGAKCPIISKSRCGQVRHVWSAWTERFTGVPIGEVDEATRALVAPLVERAGLVAAFNDAWLLLGGLVILSMLVLLVRAPTRSGSST
jgi:hypothetical protein